MITFTKIEGYNNKYYISRCGKIYRERYTDCLGRIYNDFYLSVLLDSSTGYNFVWLIEGNYRKKRYLHRLLGQQFIPNPENKRTINHINGIKTDNRLENLEWATVKENNQHAYDRKLKEGSKGVNNPNHRKIKQLSLDGKLIKIWDGLRHTGRELEINYQCISEVLRGDRKTTAGYKWEYA